MKIIEIIVLLSVLGFFFKSAFKFIIASIRHKRRMKRLEEFNEFMVLCKSWAEEIDDLKIRQEFVESWFSKLTSVDLTSEIFFDYLCKEWSVETTTQQIFVKWGKWIPSLTQQVRNERINELIK